MKLFALRFPVYALSCIWILVVGSTVWGQLPMETLFECLSEENGAEALITALKIITNMAPIVAIWIPWKLTPKWWRENEVKRRKVVITYFIFAVVVNSSYLIGIRELSINNSVFRQQLWNLAFFPTLLIASKWWFLDEKEFESFNLVFLFAVLLALLFLHNLTVG